jgi:hypothetical protein
VVDSPGIDFFTPAKAKLLTIKIVVDSPDRDFFTPATAKHSTLEIVVGPPMRNFRTPAKAKYVLHLRIETVVDKINTTCW